MRKAIVINLLNTPSSCKALFDRTQELSRNAAALQMSMELILALPEIAGYRGHGQQYLKKYFSVAQDLNLDRAIAAHDE